MALYEIRDEVKKAIETMCDITLKSNGVSAIGVVNEVLSILSNPVSEKK